MAEAEEEYAVENAPEDTGAEAAATFTLPKPGDVLACDFRSEPALSEDHGDIAEAAPSTPAALAKKPTHIKIMSWNIHRGYDLKAIEREIGRVNPDVLFLQEVDMRCDRTNGADVGAELAQALGYNLVFACAFEEIYSPLRKPEDQGGGVSGSCILSRYDFEVVRAIVHKEQPVDWEFPGPIPNEPRRGLRLTPMVVAKTPLGPLACYCIHLEEYCGIEARLTQFMEVLEDAGRLKMPVVVGGDFNTKAHGLARLSPWYCGDWLRVGSLGSTENEMWDEMLWGDEELNGGFFDPFEDDIVTFSGSGGWFQAKTDQIHLRGLNFAEPALGGKLADLNETPALSTHRWLSVMVAPAGAAGAAIPVEESTDTAALLNPAKEWESEAVDQEGEGSL
eukprot:m.57878 g.57878  ORF g.57878 m.57878 type:complete len:392 (+) comp12140_c0_seq4:87-1262(+)